MKTEVSETQKQDGRLNQTQNEERARLQEQEHNERSRCPVVVLLHHQQPIILRQSDDLQVQQYSICCLLNVR